MSKAIAELLSILDLEQIEVNLFRGRSPQSRWQRVFGGQVVGQALVAAGRMVEQAERTPHSLHAYFLIGGDPRVPIVYSVERLRDGGSFSTRRVTAIQHGQPIFAMSVSFQRPEESFTHQAAMPDAPAPETLPDEQEMRRSVLPQMPDPVRSYYERERPIELRPVEFNRYLGRPVSDQAFRVWIRASGPLPNDPAVHRAVLAYASDMTLLDSALIPHGKSVFLKEIMGASLDHAMWLHRPFRADDWMLYAQDSPNMSGARGFARGQIFARDGTLVASVAQEGLLRRRRID